MRRFILATAAVVVSTFSGFARADENPCEGAKFVAGRIAEKLGMTDEQKARAKEILEAAKAEADAAGTCEVKHAAFRSALLKVRDEVLNDEQRGKVEAFKGAIRSRIEGALRKAGARAADALDLTEEQRAKAREILQAARTGVEAAESPMAKFQAIRSALEKVRDEVLTDEQRAKAETLKGQFREKIAGRLRQFGAVAADTLGLTDEQKAQAREILQAAREEAKGAGDLPAKLLVFKTALGKIRDGVLTPEQRIDVEAYQRLFLKAALGRLEAAGEQPW